MTLTYNQNNRLTLVEDDAVVIGEYGYNGAGQRITKTAGGATTVYHYDFDGKLLGESDASGNMTAEYVYKGRIPIAKIDNCTTVSNDGILLSQMTGWVRG